MFSVLIFLKSCLNCFMPSFFEQILAVILSTFDSVYQLISILSFLGFLILAYFMNQNQNFIGLKNNLNQKRKAQYYQTVENSPNPIFSINQNGEILLWNHACQKTYHYGSDIVGQSWEKLLTEENLPHMRSIVSQVFQDKKSFTGIEITYRCANQTKYFTISRLYPLLNDQQQVSECVIANTNITERKQAELEREELLAREQAAKAKIEQILERISDGFFALDRNWKIIYLNSQAGLLMGKKNAELLEKNLWEIYPEAVDSIFYDKYHQALNTETPTHFEAFYPTLNCWYEVHAYPDEDGLSIYFRDITEYKNAQAQLKQREQFLQAIYDYTQYGIFIVDVLENNTFQYVGLNPIHEQLTGLLTPNIQGKTPQEILSPDLAEAIEQNYRRCLKAGTVINYEEFMPFCGQDYWWLTSLSPVRNETGKIYRIIGTTTNITSLKQAEIRFQNLTANIPGAIFQYVVYPDGSEAVTYMSPGCSQLWEVSPQEVEKNAEILWRIIHPDDISGMQTSVMESAQTLESWFYEWRIITPSGLQKWLQGAGKPQRKTNGEIVWDTIILDVTNLKQAEKQLQNLAANIPGVIYRYILYADGSDGMIYVSPGSQSLWEIDNHDVIEDVNRTWKMVPPEDLPKMRDSVLVSAKTLQTWFYQWRITTPSDQTKWLQAIGKPERQLNGDVIWDGLILDISERKRAEAALSESEERYRLLAENMSDLVCFHDLEGRFIYVSPSCKTLLGYDSEELIGQDPYTFFHPEDRDRISPLFHQAALSPQPTPSTYRMQKKSGRYIWLETLTTPIVDHGGEVIHLQTTSRDVTDRVRVEQQLRHDALHDSLTGLPNRNFLINRLELAIQRLERYPSFQFAILFLDLDRFKIINDSLGHMAGDELLITVAHLLQKLLRNIDIAARFGGDEFVILLEEIENINEAVQVAQRIIETLKSPFVIEEQEVFITPSIGIVYGSSSYTQALDLLRDADTAMYRAKAKGGEGYEIFNPSMYQQALKRLHLEHDLRQALEREDFVLYYQPIIALDTGKIAGMEALVRWQHPKKGLIPPTDFIPIAEETGLIIPLGMWVLKTACLQMKTWHKQFLETQKLKMSVNLSGRQLRHPHLIEQIRQILTLTNFSAQNLTLELTESILLDDIENIITLLSQLRSHSIQLSIDDFGTGYSSLSYLQRLPLNTLKIDRSFVNCIGKQGEGSEIVDIIMMLAEKLKLEVVAEGIETQSQLEYLKQLGCPLAQGYLIAKPLTVDALTTLFQQSWQYQ